MLNKPPIVSVILPFKNNEKTIHASIQSIIRQSLRDIEIICIDNGCHDNSRNILSRINDTRIRIVNSPGNIADALNTGVALSRGQYIARMDSDDISLPCRLRNQLRYLKTHNLDLVGSNAITFGEKYALLLYPRHHEDILYKMQMETPFCHPTIFGKSSVFKQYPYDNAYIYSQDYELWSRLSLCDAKFKFGNITKPLLLYRIQNNDTDKFFFKKKIIEKYHKSFNERFQNLQLDAVCDKNHLLVALLNEAITSHQKYTLINRLRREGIKFDRLIYKSLLRNALKKPLVLLALIKYKIST